MVSGSGQHVLQAQERDPLYRSIADVVVATGDQQARRLAREIVEQLEAIGTA